MKRPCSVASLFHLGSSARAFPFVLVYGRVCDILILRRNEDLRWHQTRGSSTTAKGMKNVDFERAPVAKRRTRRKKEE